MHKLTVLLGYVWCVAALSIFAADKPRETRCYELRTYYAVPGKLEELHARFRNHTCKLFEKHGMTNIGYWTPAEGPEASNTLVYILAYPSREGRENAWRAFTSSFMGDGELAAQVIRIVANFAALWLWGYVKPKTKIPQSARL